MDAMGLRARLTEPLRFRIAGRQIELLPSSIALALPAVLFFVFVVAYSSNVPHWDDFNVIPLLDHFLHGRLTFAELWAQHNENRILFPNLAWIAFTVLSGDNLRLVMTFDAILMIASALLLLAVWRRHVPMSGWGTVPAAFLFFTLTQHENALWAFQLSWYLIMIALAVEIWLLDDLEKMPWGYAIAILAAIFASFSSLQGIFCWAVGVLFLLERKRRAQLYVWLGFALVTIIVYMWGLDLHQTGAPLASPLTRPIASAYYWIVSVGGLFTGNVLSNSADIYLAAVFGFSIMVFVPLAIYVVRRFELPYEQTRLPLALLMFGALFLAAIVFGRSSGDIVTAVASRYMTFDVFLPIGTYLILVLAVRKAPESFVCRYGTAAFSTIVALAIVTGLVIGNGAGAYTKFSRDQTIAVFVKPASASDDLVKNLWCCPELVRSLSVVAKADHVMTFAGKADIALQR